MNNFEIPINLSSATGGTVYFTNGGKGVVKLVVNWTSTPNESNNTSYVRATMTLEASASGNAVGGSYLSVNGNTRDFSGLYLSKDHSGTQLHTLATVETTVYHDSDGTKTINISGKLVWNGYMWNHGSVTVSSISGSENVQLETINTGTVPVIQNLGVTGSGTIEGHFGCWAEYSCDKPKGTYYYQFSYRYDGIDWQYTDWQTNNGFDINVTDISRGVSWAFRARVKNDVGESEWTAYRYVYSNRLPNEPSSLYPSYYHPTTSVNLQFHGNGDPDGQTTCYDIYMSKNDEKGVFIWGDRSASASIDYSVPYDVSGDPAGTKYQYSVVTSDILKAYTSAVYSDVFYKPSPLPAPTTTMSCKQDSGVGTGNATITSNCDTSNAIGNVTYQLSYIYDGVDWQYTGWQSNNVFNINLDVAQGKHWRFKTIVKDDVGNSPWSSDIAIISDSPPIPPTNMRVSSKYSADNVTLSWDAGSDNETEVKYYSVYVSKNHTGYDGYEWYKDTTDTSVVFSFGDDPAGTFYRFCCDAVDNLGVSRRCNYASELFYKSIAPTTPSINNPSQTIFEDGFTIDWSASDFYGVGGKYVIHKCVNDGEWESVSENYDGESLYVDIPNILNRGDTIAFAIKGKNNIGQISKWAHSIGFKRNMLPNATSDIRPKDKYISGIVNFNWNEATDPDGQAIKYNLYISINGEAKQSIGSTTATSYIWSIPMEDQGNDTYKLGVESVDSLGARNLAWGPTFRKPQVPCYPTDLRPSSGIFEETVTLEWNRANFNGQFGHYKIKVFCNEDVVLNTSTMDNSYTINLESLGVPRGAKVHYSLIAENSFSQISEEQFSGTFTRNQIPCSPQILYPKSLSTIHSKRPRIIVQLGDEYDNQKMSLKIIINGKSYTSLANSDCFSMSKARSGTVIDFRPSHDIDTGNINITCLATDGMHYSNPCNILIKSILPVQSEDNGNIIDAYSMNSILSGQDDVLWSCNLLTSSYVPVKPGEAIKASIINTLINNVKKAINKINGLIDSPKFNYNLEVENVASGDVIKAATIKKVSYIINNM